MSVRPRGHNTVLDFRRELGLEIDVNLLLWKKEKPLEVQGVKGLSKSK